MTETPRNEFVFKAYTLFITAVGIGVCIISGKDLSIDRLDWEFIILAAITLVIGSGVAVGIRIARLSVSLSDVFTILVFLLYGAPAAIVLSAFEAFLSSGRYTKSLGIRLFNSAVMPISFFCAFEATERIVGAHVINTGIGRDAVLTVATIVFIHYLVNTSLVAASSAIRERRFAVDVWKEQYLWMIVPFGASGSIAMVCAALITSAGFVAFLLALPIVGVLYFTYVNYDEKLEAVTAQAEQAERHVKELTESEERFRSAFTNAPIGIGILSMSGEWLEVNGALSDILGYPPEQFRDKPLGEMVHPDDLYQFLVEIGKVIQRKKRSFQAELRFLNRAGEEIWTLSSISWLNESEDARLICQAQDISARRAAEEKLKKSAFFDALTGLSNYNFFVEKLAEAMDGRRENRRPLTVVAIDIDRFKLVNDSFGHRMGDRLLVAVGQRLRNFVPEQGTVARFGSDEFYVLYEKEFDGNELQLALEEMQRQIGRVYSILGQELAITVSLGVITAGESHTSPDEILRDAESALKLSKSGGMHRFVIFDDEMRTQTLTRIRLEKDLGGAVDRNELRLVYQPIVRLDGQELEGYEALLRWKHPELGEIPPSRFIPIAEETGLIIRIGRFVLDEACRQLDLWRRELGTGLDIRMSVNLSPRQILRRGVLNDVLDSLDRFSIPPEMLKLELTESVIVENTDVVISTLKQLRAAGIAFSLDDFGTGYSSLSYLHRLPINNLKIDRSFVARMNENTECAEIIRTIILLARNLDLETVAEGIETQEQLDSLASLGCTFGQGYLLSKPLEASAARDYLENSLVRLGVVGAVGVIESRPDLRGK